MTRTRSRRSVLAGTGLAVASAGCVGRVRNIVGRERSDQLTLEVLTLPADSDPNAVRIAQHLRGHMSEAGIDARINTVDQAELLRRSLLNHDYDIYVGQFPQAVPFEADSLYSFVHSRFAAESGWQNPFGFTELAVDDLLGEQRSADTERRMEHLAELQEALCELQPLSVVAFPDAVTAYRDERFDGWEFGHPTSAQGLLRLSFIPPEERDGEDDGDEDADEPATLRLATTDDRITENWNPIAAEYRRHGTFMSMLYDPLVRRHDDGPLPWLAAGWEWADAETIRVDLRDADWHDGEPLTADDVAFTYEFLRDTSSGEAETPVPTPIFRGRTTIPETVTAIDRSTVEFEVGSVNTAVAERALEVPVLPEHIWRDRTELVNIAGIALDEETTEALVSPNDEPVGSGPITLVDATAETEAVFERNSDHFLLDLDPLDPAAEGDSEDDTTDERPGEENGTGQDDTGGTRRIPNAFRGKPSFERLVVEVVPSDIAAVQQVGDGLADATLSNIGPEAVPRIGREADARLVNVRSAAFYHVGYNVRRAPLSNPRFRAVLASMIDKAAIVDDAFQGYAAPATSMLAASPGLVPEDLRWDDDRGTDAVHPFRGRDGELDVDAVREAFREAGYRYNAEGELLSRDQ